jgi:protein-tyrosine-phosphatase
VIEVMREIGIDIAGRRPKKLDREMQLHADWAITLHCKAACPYVAAAIEDLGSRRSRQAAARRGAPHPGRAR